MLETSINAKLFDDKMPRSLSYPIVPVHTILKGSAEKYGNIPAYIYRGKEITYKELYRQALLFANALKKLGVKKGDVIACHLPTCIQNIEVYYGIIMTGAIFSPVNPILPPRGLLHQLNNCDAKVVVTHEAVAENIEATIDETKIEIAIITGDQELCNNDNPIKADIYGPNWYSFAQLKKDSVANELNVDIDPEEDLVHISYTGGTTGLPKGVMTTHFNLIANAIQSAAWSNGVLPQITNRGGLVINPVEVDGEKYLEEYASLPGTSQRLSPAPLHHNAGILGGIIFAVLTGSTTYLFDRFDPEQFLADIEKYKITEISGSPAMFNYLLRHPSISKYDYSSIRMVNSGAAPLVNEVMRLLIKNFPNAAVTEGYGLTEATANTVQSVSFRSGYRVIGTVGLPIYDTKVKLLDLENEEEIKEVGVPGEICIKGPQVMKGYYKNPEETKKTLVDGWLKTGDIGVFDENGFLSIVDRKKDMIIYNAYNVYPSELEDLLYQHPAIQSAAVIGKPHPQSGEIPKAFVVKYPQAEVTEEEILEYVNNQVVHYKKIRELEFIDNLPMTAAGKISKITLLKQELEKQN